MVGTASSKIQKVSSDELPKKAPPGRPKKNIAVYEHKPSQSIRSFFNRGNANEGPPVVSIAADIKDKVTTEANSKMNTLPSSVVKLMSTCILTNDTVASSPINSIQNYFSTEKKQDSITIPSVATTTELVEEIAKPLRWGRNNELHIPIYYSNDVEYGFPWANNSCGFDSVMSALWFLFRHSEVVRIHFHIQMPRIAMVFTEMIDSITNLEAKDQLIAMFGKCTPLSGNFVSTDSTNAALEQFIAEQTVGAMISLFNVDFHLVSKCSNVNCNSTRERELNWDGISVRNRNLRKDMMDTIEATLQDMDGGRYSSCIQCTSKCKKSRSVFKSPLILKINFSPLTLMNAPTTIQEEIYFHDSTYILAAVVYGNDSHFITRYKHFDGRIFDYDGMQRNGYGRPVSRHAVCIDRSNDLETRFNGRIRDCNHRIPYFVNQCFYLKKN